MNNLTQEQQLLKVAQVKDYHNAAGLNRGLLVQLIHGPQGYLEMQDSPKSDLYYEEKESQIIGNAVETKVLLGDFAFNAGYYHPQLATKPSDTVMSVMQKLYDQTLADRLDDLDDDVLEDVMIAEGYRKDQNWGLEAKLRNLRKEGSDYYDSLVHCQGRQLLSSEELVVIGVVADNLWSSALLHRYLKPEETDTEVTVQSVIFFEHRGYQCKAMLDIEQVNHKAKTARVIDLKTTKEKIYGFTKAIYQWRYDLQLAFYCLALMKKYPGYTILPPVLIAASTTELGAPQDFQLSMHDVDALLEARSPYIVTIRELFNRLDWYNQNGWDRHYLKTDGPVEINVRNYFGTGSAMSLYATPCPQPEIDGNPLEVTTTAEAAS